MLLVQREYKQMKARYLQLLNIFTQALLKTLNSAYTLWSIYVNKKLICLPYRSKLTPISYDIKTTCLKVCRSQSCCQNTFNLLRPRHHKTSEGVLRFGEYGGQFSTLKSLSCSSDHSWIIFAVWNISLSPVDCPSLDTFCRYHHCISETPLKTCHLGDALTQLFSHHSFFPLPFTLRTDCSDWTIHPTSIVQCHSNKIQK